MTSLQHVLTINNMEKLNLHNSILRILGACRALPGRNIYAILSQKLISDNIEYASAPVRKNFHSKLTEMVKSGVLDTFESPYISDFSDENFNININVGSQKVYFLSQTEGLKKLDFYGLASGTIPTLFRTFNYPIYTYINHLFLPEMNRFEYLFDSPRFNRGSTAVHEIHGQIKMRLLSVSNEIGIPFKYMKVGIKFLTSSECKVSYLRFFEKYVLNSSKSYDWFFLIHNSNLSKECHIYFEEDNISKLFQRYSYISEKYPNQKSYEKKLSEKMTKKNQPYKGGCSVSLLSLEEAYNTVRRRKIYEN